MNKTPSWFCAQIGAREHYAISRALHKTGRLSRLYTDFWAGPLVKATGSRVPISSLRNLASRFHPELAGAPITDWKLRWFAWETGIRYRWRNNSITGNYPGFIEVGRRFSIRVSEALDKQTELGPRSIFFAYDTGALESFEKCREHEVRCVLNQMDPSRVEASLVREEEKLWPGWQAQSVTVPEAYFRRREQEWALADRIVVNSEFSRLALLQQGVPAAKLVVIPLCYESDNQNQKIESRKQKSSEHQKSNSEFQLSTFQISAFSRARPLRVLWLGQVILRKGIQYLIEAAKLLQGENIQFDIVGPIGISQAAMASAPKNLTFHGRATRDQAAGWYQKADVFVLPTLSDGFALTQLEAMSHGVPVIATPCCGDVVSDGVDGFLIPPRDSNSLAKALTRYLTEPGLLQSQRAAALLKSRQFTLAHLTANLLRLETDLLSA